jgi:hypothetical protein
MATNESAADAASLALPVSCQGFLMKHGGFFFKKVPASLEIVLFLSDTHRILILSAGAKAILHSEG